MILAALIHSFTKLNPISIGKMGQMWQQTEGEPTVKRVEKTLEPMVGITPVAQKEIRSPAENMALEIQAEKRPAGGRSREDIQKDKDLRDMRGFLRQAFGLTKKDELSPEDVSKLKAKIPRFKEIVTGGNLSIKDINSQMKLALKPPLEDTAQKLGVKELNRVWAVSSQHEKAILAPIILKKMVDMVKTGSPNEIKSLVPFAKTLQKEGFFSAKPQAEAQPVQQPAGLVEPGTIKNLWDRPILHNPDGTYSTTSSMSFNEDGKEVLIPTVVDGVRLSKQAAIAHYQKTGEHLGKFDTPDHADAYAADLHNKQAAYIAEKHNAK
jgi:hypothetical protein